MKLFYTFSLGVLLCLSSSASAAPAIRTEPEAECSTIHERKEWRDLSIEDRRGYIDAVLCLQAIPSKKPGGAATTRYEEFQATHIALTLRVHTVGQFLPWHRHLVTQYANALREECGYKGPFAYWDWTRDADSDAPFAESPLFDNVTGFGGDGTPGTYTLPPDPNGLSAVGSKPWKYKGCVESGPFNSSSYVARLGPGRLKTQHCLVRGFDTEAWKSSLTSTRVEETLTAPTFWDFQLSIDSLVNGIHSGGHAIIGGEMMNIYSAGADPLFYLHHANLDRVWWMWQQADPSNRVYQIAGPTEQGGNTPVTLDFDLDYPGLGPSVTLRDVMDPALQPGCFTY